jgi:serine/threonine protein kinase
MQGKIGVFEIIKTIGTGASCKVKLGIDTRTNKKVAIKVIKNDMEQKLKDLLQVEVKAMACLNHDNIVN